MLVPLGTDRRLKRPTVITYWLIGINVAVFVFGAIYGSPRINPGGFERFFHAFKLDPLALTAWGFVTYQFLHGGLIHLFGNMLFLYVFGPNVEDRLGRAWFLAFYLVGGAFAGGTHYLFEMAPVVGASGSIAAITGAYLVLFPKTHIRIFVLFFIIGVFHVPAWWLIGFAISKDVFFQGLGAGQGVALLAHLGGYAFGAFVSVTLLWSGLLPRETYDLFSMGRQAHRRRVFRELASSGKTAWTHEMGPSSKVRAAEGGGRGKVTLDAAAEARAAISGLIAQGQLDQAAEAWEAMTEERGETALPRQAHLELANHMYATGRKQSAAVAYEVYLKRHSGDRQATEVRVMLALICTRFLNDPLRAKQLLSEAKTAGLPESLVQLAQTLTDELG